MSHGVAVTSGQGVLLPESTRKNRKEKRITIAVNSRDRNFGQFFDSNNFRWSLRRPLKDVVAVELINGHVPADLYNMNTGWNSFTFSEADGARNWAVTLTPGQYTATQLASELQTQLNGLAGVANTYTVGYSDITKKYSITSAGPANFSFLFAVPPFMDELDTHTGALMSVNSPARILGFERFNYPGPTGGTLVAPYRADPDLFLKRLYLHVNADNSIDLHRVEMGAGRRDCFHVLYMDQIKDGYYALNKDQYTPIFYSAPAPIARITTLNISIRDEFYRLVDLGRHDFTLLFEITYLDT